MNCQAVRTKITEGLAAGISELPDEVSRHREHCPECCAFYETQQHLFATIDAGVQTIANAPIPPSLLPGLRSRIENIAPPHRSWSFVLWTGAGAAAVACVLVFLSLWRPQSQPEAPAAVAPMARLKRELAVPRQMPQKRVAPAPVSARRSTGRVLRTRSVPESPETSAMEVVIDYGESRGLVLLARVASQEPNMAQTLAPQHDTSPVAITPVTIPVLEITPLVEGNR